MRLFVIIFSLLVFSGCGFLDDDLMVDNELYEQSFEFEAMSLSGHGRGGTGYGGGYTYGCGGFRIGRRIRREPATLSPKNGQETGFSILKEIDGNDEESAVRDLLMADLVDDYSERRHHAKRQISLRTPLLGRP